MGTREKQRSVELIHDRQGTVEELEAVGHQLAATAWWQFGERSTLAAQHRDLKAHRLAIEHDLRDAAPWDRWVGVVIHEGLSRDWDGTSHLYHPRILDDLDATVARVLEAAPSINLARPGLWWEELLAGDVPEVVGRLTPQRVRADICRSVQRLQTIVEDPHILTEWQPRDAAADVLIVQHQRSGLRVRFTPGEEGIGSVFSKPYSIGSIDDADRGETHTSWESYTGLGIGRRLYRKGAGLIPGQRWAAGASSDSAAALRRRLHVADPYRWAAACDWCGIREITWRDASVGDYREHPTGL